MALWKRKETRQQTMDKTAEAVMKELHAEYRRRMVLQTMRSGLKPFHRKPSAQNVPASRFKLTWVSPEGVNEPDPFPKKGLFSRSRAWFRKRKMRKLLRRLALRTHHF